MSKNVLVGQVSQIGQTEEFGENGFKKRELILKTVEEFPSFFKVEFTGDKINLLDSFKDGQNVKIIAYLKGREYKTDDKYDVFMSLRASEIEILS